ncbi:MAG TPA: hypothetical protein DCZ92_12300 [Elusimicrobia bacterium]|nr:MAG: hypothetical protein A2016_00980 [Elusimicrobia bacterium GWF2_62_30]HBA61570.1 hypothetical protein [Elusimicrobiota bacterium]
MGNMTPFDIKTRRSGAARPAPGAALLCAALIFLAGPGPALAQFSGGFSLAGGAVYDSGLEDFAGGITLDTVTAGGPYVYVVGGSSSGAACGHLAIKYDSGGLLLSSAGFTVGGYNADLGVMREGITRDSSGNIYELFTSSTPAGTDIAILRYDKDLVFLSSAVFDGGYDDFGAALAADGAGNVYLAGASSYGGSLAKYGPGLVFLSSATLDDYSASGNAVALDAAGDVYVTGQAAGSDLFIARFGPGLLFKSSATLAAGGYAEGRGIQAGPSGSIYVTGASGSDLLLVRYSSGLVFLSSTVFDSGGSDWGNSLAIDTAGVLHVAGGAGLDGALLRYGPDLAFISSSAFSSGRFPAAIALDGLGGAYVAGSMYNGSDLDLRTIKYVLAAPSPAPAPAAPVFTGPAFRVYNFPNPFRPGEKTVTISADGGTSWPPGARTVRGTVIKYHLPAGSSGRVKFVIYGLAGEKVRALDEGYRTGGAPYYAEWDGRNEKGAACAAGVYFLAAYLGGARLGKPHKLTLLR